MISFSSAWQSETFIIDQNKIDTLNTKTIYGSYIIEETSWYDPFGIWTKETIKEVTLKNNTDICGQDCYAIKEIKNLEKSSLIDNVRFYRIYDDGSHQLSNIRNYQFSYWGTIEDYETQCIDEKEIISLNGTSYTPQICNQILTGSHEGWISYKLGTKMPIGTYTIKLVGHKKPSWSYDWQVLLGDTSTWTESWATWGLISGGDEAEVILNSPVDDYILLSNPQSFNCSAKVTGGATIKNMSLWTNETGSWENKNTTIVSGDEINDSSQQPLSHTSSGDGCRRGFRVNATKEVTLIKVWKKSDCTANEVYIWWTNGTLITSSPITGNLASFSLVLLEGNEYYIGAGSDGAVYTRRFTNGNIFPKVGTNLDLIQGFAELSGGSGNLNAPACQDVSFNIMNITTQHVLTTSTQIFKRTLTDTTLWTCQACDSDGDCGFATTNRTLLIDLTIPTFQSISGNGTQNYGALDINHTINTTITDTNLDTCWYDYNETNTTFSCSSGINDFNFTLQNNIFNLTLWANDSVGNENYTFIEWDYLIFENNRTHNTTSYETASETFSIYLTANSTLSGVTLDFNGTEYSTTQSGNIWSKRIDVPTSLGNKSITWNYTYAGNTINSEYITYQNISETIFTLCDTTYSDDFLNITFKDEADLSNMNASIPTATFIYYLGDGDVTKTYNFLNNTDNYNYKFCATPDRTLHVDPYVQYKKDSDYPQRTWDIITQDYTDTLTTQILYLLDSSDGIYVTLQVVNNVDQLLSDVSVTATREIESVDTTVAFGTTGSPGTVTFWLNPDFSHDFKFTKSGYTDYETSFAPTQTSYTITMGGSASSTENSTIRGILYSVIPTNNYLINDTDYTFGFNLTSTYYDVDNYGFNLRLKNGTEIDGGHTVTEGTSLTKIYNVSNQTIIYLDYYWLVNDVYTNSTRYWIVYNTARSQYSIAAFFEKLDEYLDSEIYGLDNFGRSLIVFLILFISIGIMSYKYGATSPLAISSLIFGIIFFFDVVVGLIPTIRGIEGLPTFLAALILVLSIFNEVKT